MEGILQDALEVYARVPRRGAETGGILLGRKDHDGLTIQDFAPVPSEHRFGRLYRLSDLDRRHLSAACDAIARRTGGMEVVGLYRTHARDEQDPTGEDAEIVADHLAEDRRVLLLVRPALTRPTVASFFFWRDGRLVEPVETSAFPFEGAAAPVVPAAATVDLPRPAPSLPRLHVVPPLPPPPVAAPPLPVEPAPVIPPVIPKTVELPPPAPRFLAEESPRESHKLRWLALAGLFGAAVTGGYLSRPQPLPPPAAVAPAFEPAEIPSTPAPAVVNPDPQPKVSAPAPAPPPPVANRDRQETARPETPRQEAPRPQLEVRTFLDRWADAVRQGRLDRVGFFYAPATRGIALANLEQRLGAAPRMDVFRLSDVSIVYPEPGEAIAIATEHWQSGVASKSAGEQSVRLTLRSDGDRWHIVSEQVEKVHWIQKLR